LPAVISLAPLPALLYSFLLGLLHGILPDEHTWPITFSYAIGGASGKAGLKAGFYFSLAFTIQRTLLSGLAYFALAPFLKNELVSGIVYILVGIVMAAAGAIVLARNRHPHLHLFGHHHDALHEMERSPKILSRQHVPSAESLAAPPAHWALIHGFIAGFGFEGFMVYISSAAAGMPNAWLGFLPGLFFGLGTMVMLVILGTLFGALMRRLRGLKMEEIQKFGILTSGRTLFWGGLLFSVFGVAAVLHLDHLIEKELHIEPGYFLIILFIILVVMPSFFCSWKRVKAERQTTEA
jgi:sulfite exporter TauE/SafE